MGEVGPETWDFIVVGAGSAGCVTAERLSAEHDQKSAVALMRFMRAYMAADPLGGMVGPEQMPGTEVESDEALQVAFRKLSTCGLHAIGSCRMGANNRAADMMLADRKA